jgi:hypothetical protein
MKSCFELEEEKRSIDDWRVTGYDVILSANDRKVWLIYCPEEGCVGLPEDQHMSPKTVDKQEGLLIFDSVTDMVEALRRDGKEEMFKSRTIGDSIFGETRWWTVRDEDLKKYNVTTKKTSLAAVGAKE